MQKLPNPKESKPVASLAAAQAGCLGEGLGAPKGYPALARTFDLLQGAALVAGWK